MTDIRYKTNPVVDDLQHKAKVAAIEQKLIAWLGVHSQNDWDELQDNSHIGSYGAPGVPRRALILGIPP